MKKPNKQQYQASPANTVGGADVHGRVSPLAVWATLPNTAAHTKTIWMRYGTRAFFNGGRATTVLSHSRHGGIFTACAGVDAIVIPTKGGAAINADAVKTSAGALLSIPVCREASLTNVLKFLASSGIKIVAATEKASMNYTESSMTEPIAIVMGSEDEGVAPEHLRICDDMIRIPLLGSIDSLNVSVAAGVLIYEAVRQRQINA